MHAYVHVQSLVLSTSTLGTLLTCGYQIAMPLQRYKDSQKQVDACKHRSNELESSEEYDDNDDAHHMNASKM